LLDPFDHAVNFRSPGDICLDRYGASSQSFYQGTGFLSRFFLDAKIHRNIGPGFSQRCGAPPSDSPTGTCDQGYFPGELIHVSPPL
jgi:hypothetical protein